MFGFSPRSWQNAQELSQGTHRALFGFFLRVGPVKNRPHPIQNDSDSGALALAELRAAGYSARSITTYWPNELFQGAAISLDL